MRSAAIVLLTAFCFYRLFTITHATQTNAASSPSTPSIAIPPPPNCCSYARAKPAKIARPNAQSKSRSGASSRRRIASLQAQRKQTAHPPSTAVTRFPVILSASLHRRIPRPAPAETPPAPARAGRGRAATSSSFRRRFSRTSQTADTAGKAPCNSGGR